MTSVWLKNVSDSGSKTRRQLWKSVAKGEARRADTFAEEWKINIWPADRPETRSVLKICFCTANKPAQATRKTSAQTQTEDLR